MLGSDSQTKTRGMRGIIQAQRGTWGREEWSERERDRVQLDKGVSGLLRVRGHSQMIAQREPGVGWGTRLGPRTES